MNKFTELKEKASAKVTELKENVTNKVTELKDNAVNKFTELKEKASAKVTELKETAVSKFVEMKDKTVAQIISLKDESINHFNDMKDKAIAGFEQLKAGAIERFTALSSGIKQTLENVQSFVSNAVQKLKGFFNFEWKLPNIKLPHFSIDGSFSLDPPSIPKIGVEWYKNGGIMTEPTAFGFNSGTGKIMVGGEAGAEAIAPIETLKEYVKEAVSDSNYQMYEVVNRILSLLLEYLPQLTRMQLVMDSGALVGELAQPLNEELGRILYMRGRQS